MLDFALSFAPATNFREDSEMDRNVNKRVELEHSAS